MGSGARVTLDNGLQVGKGPRLLSQGVVTWMNACDHAVQGWVRVMSEFD